MTPDPTSTRWPRLAHQADDPLFVLSARHRLLYANPAWERWAGVDLAAVRGQPCRANSESPALALMTPTDDVRAGRPSCVRRRGLAGQASWVDVHFFPWTKSGEVFTILGRIIPIAVPGDKTPPLPEGLVQLRDAPRLDAWESDVPAVRTVVAQARLAGQTTVPVLLVGPSGCGKGWLARAIHHVGPRRDQYFARLDVSRLPPSLLAEVLLQRTRPLNLGAVLLSGVERLRPDLAARLVEMIDAESFGPRLFVSTADDSSLPPDLAGRVRTLTIRVPSLAERRADWPRLVPPLVARVERTLSGDADRALQLHSWPGNFRELLSVLRTAARRTSARIELNDLPLALRDRPPAAEPKLPLDELLEKTERRLIELALEQCRHNKTKAAQVLGIWRARLLRRMEQFGIAGDEGRDDA